VCYTHAPRETRQNKRVSSVAINQRGYPNLRRAVTAGRLYIILYAASSFRHYRRPDSVSILIYYY